MRNNYLLINRFCQKKERSVEITWISPFKFTFYNLFEYISDFMAVYLRSLLLQAYSQWTHNPKLTKTLGNDLVGDKLKETNCFESECMCVSLAPCLND